MDDEQPAKEPTKICGVCGDRALGYNFNAVSCESCKAFFRRNALRTKDFRCPFTENCKITPVTRRFCQKCRLDKCLRIGMRKDYIMSEEDKVLKREKIEKNRAKKRSQFDNATASKIKKDCVEDCTFEDTSVSVNSVASTMSESYFWESDRKYTDLDGNRQNVVESMSPVTAASVPSPSSPPESTNIAETKTLDMLKESAHSSRSNLMRIPIAANSIESILCEAIKLEYSAFSSLGGNQSSRDLNDAERAKLNELIVANKALLAPLDDDITNLVGEECKFKNNFGQSDPMLLDVINLTAIAIRRLIKMSKKINAFKNMCQEDQLALLKGGCTEMMILRSAINYDPDKDIWKIPHSQESMSNIKVDVLKEAKGNLYAEHAKFVRTFDARWRDENIILILSAIALFTPDRPRVVHSDVIKLEQSSYYYLLRRYLESVYPGCEAKSMFLKLIQKISELHKLNDEVVGVYLNVNPSSVEPLLIEIFDLKH
ncbi:hypothetical protein ACFW04_000921 [Cataglyphis niger]